MVDHKSWRMDFDNLVSEKKSGADPPGLDANIARETSSLVPAKKKDPSVQNRKQQALYARATAPLKQVGFMCFMAWMFGNSIQIFSIIMTFSLLAQPISAILSSKDVFPQDEEYKLDTLLPRLVYCLIHGGQVLFGLYKLNAMGLLPVFASDWISTVPVSQTLEHSYSAIN